MWKYDPAHAPDPEKWLALDEQLRIAAVEKFHRDARIKMPNVRVHAALQAVIENQIAEQHAPAVRAMERLGKQGLSRHDCLHAIAWVLSGHIYRLATTELATPAGAVQAQYDAAVERLTADDWLSQAE